MSFLIGCDPELFLHNGTKFVSAIDKVGGSKDYPKPIGNGCAVQEDNVAVEFCIPPADSCDKFYDSIMYSLDTILKEVPAFEFSKNASAEFDDTELDHPMAHQFGCEPDFNAWTKKENPRPCSTNYKLRSAGGHVHVGIKGVDKYQLIRAMDLFLGVPSINMDTDTRRRELYGKAGAFRPKSYGAEYRTLSNFWIWDKRLIEWVYHQTSLAIDYVKSGRKLNASDGKLIQTCINTGNPKLIKDIQVMYG